MSKGAVIQLMKSTAIFIQIQQGQVRLTQLMVGTWPVMKTGPWTTLSTTHF